MEQQLIYESPRDGWTKAEIEASLARGDAEELLRVPIDISLATPDPGWSQAICIGLAGHADIRVRMSAILGLAHLGRIHRRLDEARVRPLVEAALRDPDPAMRGRAGDVADDLEMFLGWRFARS